MQRHFYADFNEWSALDSRKAFSGESKLYHCSLSAPEEQYYTFAEIDVEVTFV